MALTEAVVWQAKTTGKDYTLDDTDGLVLFVTARGAKMWHFRFIWIGKQQRVAVGSYPKMSLKDAREQRDDLRAQTAHGVDPRVHRLHFKAAELAAPLNTFACVFKAWRDFKALNLKTGRQSTLSQIDRIFAKDVPPQPAIDIVRVLIDEHARRPAQHYLLSHRSRLKERISEIRSTRAASHGLCRPLTGHGIRATISTALNELDDRKNGSKCSCPMPTPTRSAPPTTMRAMWGSAAQHGGDRKLSSPVGAGAFAAAGRRDCAAGSYRGLMQGFGRPC
nr:integrase arm-type DNA-binding domain-containing protein [Pseudomonas fulva]